MTWLSLGTELLLITMDDMVVPGDRVTPPQLDNVSIRGPVQYLIWSSAGLVHPATVLLVIVTYPYPNEN